MGLRDESKPSPASQSQEFIVTIDSLLASEGLSLERGCSGIARTIEGGNLNSD